MSKCPSLFWSISIQHSCLGIHMLPDAQSSLARKDFKLLIDRRAGVDPGTICVWTHRIWEPSCTGISHPATLVVVPPTPLKVRRTGGFHFYHQEFEMLRRFLCASFSESLIRSATASHLCPPSIGSALWLSLLVLSHQHSHNRPCRNLRFPNSIR